MNTAFKQQDALQMPCISFMLKDNQNNALSTRNVMTYTTMRKRMKFVKLSVKDLWINLRGSPPAMESVSNFEVKDNVHCIILTAVSHHNCRVSESRTI